MKKYFDVNVNKYDSAKKYSVYRPSSLDNPKDNSVIFVTKEYINRASNLLNVEDCLIFWNLENEVNVELIKKHVIVKCDNPREQYCLFFKENNITNLPKYEKYREINGSFISIDSKIGENVIIMPGSYIGGDCIIGDNVYIGSGTRIVGDTIIGNNVIIRENVVIGADGLSTDRGEDDGKAITMPQFGGVIIENNVQIGASVVIARGAIDNTIICDGVKIDNCTFVSHNVKIGRDSFVVGETILFGSSQVGERCLVSGNSTIMNRVVIGNDSIVGAGAVVVKSVNGNSKVKGNPAK